MNDYTISSYLMDVVVLVTIAERDAVWYRTTAYGNGSPRVGLAGIWASDETGRWYSFTRALAAYRVYNKNFFARFTYK
jgi:hypothetical protein